MHTPTAENHPELPPHQRWKQFPIYDGNDLGVHYTPEKTLFRIWAPQAAEVAVALYDSGLKGNQLGRHAMKRDIDGTWLLDLAGNWKNRYYTFQARFNETWGKEVPDPHARAVGVNGDRGMIVDLRETDPDGWQHDEKPPLADPADVVIWEIHIRDFSIHSSSGAQNRGKYLAFTETGTRSPQGLRTGIDHLKEMGVTHVHLLPAFDFATIDEARPNKPQYNWGYDPKNFNVPQGSYSTDPHDGRVRIREFKQMVQALHQHGIRVIMDVVYNHMYDAASSPFEQLAPGYFFRLDHDGNHADGSGCGNETASEREMMRQFMIGSVTHWATEYHIDGFRFDLMGLHDIGTMNLIRDALDIIDPSIVVYGEGWTAGDSPLPASERALKTHAGRMKGIAVFSDDMRDGIRGNGTGTMQPGFMAGSPGMSESVKFGVVGSIQHPQVDYGRVIHSGSPYAQTPSQTINYVTCHDNPCLWDTIVATCNGCSAEDRLAIQKLANAIVLTSQGIAFLHAGEEMVRTKLGEHNTYNLPDSINQLVWHNKAEYYDVFSFYRDLIALRRNHPAFRMRSAEMVRKHLRFLPGGDDLLLGFQISQHANGDDWEDILVFYNADDKQRELEIPPGRWRTVATKYGINELGVDTPGFDQPVKNNVVVPSRSLHILVDENSI